MPVTLRRHLATKKVDGKRRVFPSGFRASVAEAKKLKAQTKTTSVKSYSSPVQRAVAAARAGRRAFGSKGKIKIKQELGLSSVLLNEAIYVDLLMSSKYKGNEARMVADWVKGSTLGGSVVPAEAHFSKVIRRRLGLGLAAEVGKAGAGTKGVKRKGVLIDNITHSALIEPVVALLTKGLPNAFQIKKLVKENKGLVMKYVPQKNGKYKARLNYAGRSWDVTKNFKKYSLPSLQKYLDA
ncbi:MAG: hypothetical protein ACOX1V_04315 [Candidatus Iainarchaeum sp.]|nr:MAG: hypothetical protein BWY55_00476 [archaeon ADurb.Bin336]